MQREMLDNDNPYWTAVSLYGSRRRMAPLLWWMCLLPSVAFSSSAAPWQSNSWTPVLEQETLRDMPPIVFSSAGRLYLVERTVSAASSIEDNSSNLVVALCCREGVVLVTTANTSPHLHITASVDNNSDETALWMARKGRHCAPLSTIAPEMFMVTGGNAVDSCILRKKITRIAEAMLEENDGGQPLPPSKVSCAALARRVSDHLQLPTQTMGKAGRILAVGTVIIFFYCTHILREQTLTIMYIKSYAVLVGRDNRSPCLWRIDPTGQFWKCDATVIGRGASAAEAHLMDMVLSEKDESFVFSNLSTRQALSVASECIEKTLPKETKSHWQALVLRTNGEQIIAQVLHGNEIHALLLNAAAKTDGSDNEPA